MLHVILSVLVVFESVACSDDVPSVKTPLGVVVGSYRFSSQGRVFSAFEGIPYAKPPIGKLRFEEPKPAQPWLGIWNASFTTECPQISDKLIGQEDCLYINVYIPRKNPNPDEKLDVVFHIHGGAFMTGSGHFPLGPSLLMNREVILVTFNYRLGALGFLSTEDDVIPGNNGLKDQVLALKWVQENIASFGGNSNSVTITGYSAGGSSAHFHYLMPQSKNLFHRGIAHSGLTLNPWSIQEAPLQKAKLLAAGLGCPSSSSQVIKSCLKTRPFQQIAEFVRYLYAYKLLPFALFAPVVERSSNSVVKDYPFRLLQRGEINDVPLIASTTAHDGYISSILTREDLKVYDKHWYEIAPFLLDFNKTVTPSQRAEVSRKIRDFYLGDKPINEETLDQMVQMVGDRLFFVDADHVKLHAQVAKSAVYYYYFTYPGEEKYVGHAADGLYFYGDGHFSANQTKLSNMMIDMLLSFISTGIPVFGGLEWPLVRSDQLTYLNITGPDPTQNKIQTAKNHAKLEFWKSLRFAENDNLLDIKDEL